MMTGSGQVEGEVPAGAFKADQIEVDIDERRISLRGNAQLTMRPGELRVP